MASAIGVLVLLALAVGLAGALLAATRDAEPRPVERARPPR
jgi:hypothetical protein